MLTFLGATTLTTWTALAGVLSILLWWWSRERRRAYSFPLLSQISLRPSSVKKSVLKVPPLLYFFVFISLFLILLFFSFRPIWSIPPETEAEKEVQNKLWIIDLSPSLSARITIDHYRNLLKKKFSEDLTSHQWTLLFSHSLTPIHKDEMDTSQNPLEIFNNLQFHKPGFHLNAAFQILSDSLSKYHHITVFSDGDQHTWSDVNQDFLKSLPLTIINLSRKNLRKSSEPLENITLHRIEEHRRERTAQGFVWHGRAILHRYSEKKPFSSLVASTGKLKVTLIQSSESSHSSSLLTADWSLPKNVASTSIPLEILIKTPPESSSLGTKKDSQETTKALNFQISSISPSSADTITLDNSYTFPLETSPKVLMVGSPLGERTLEDPLRSIFRAFLALGYDVKRWDGFPSQQPPSQGPVDLLVNFLHRTSRLGECFYEKKTQAPSPTSLPEHLWLLPLKNPFDAQSLCLCTQKFYRKATAKNFNCEGATNREGFLKELQHHGFEPLGGDALSFNTAPFYKLTLATKLKTILISLGSLDPYDPIQKIPLHHGSLPFILEELYQLTQTHSSPLTSETSTPLTLKDFLHGNPHKTPASEDLWPSQNRRAFASITQALEFFNLKVWPTGPTYRLWHHPPIKEVDLSTLSSWSLEALDQQSPKASTLNSLRENQENHQNQSQDIIWLMSMIMVFLMIVEMVYGWWWYLVKHKAIS